MSMAPIEVLIIGGGIAGPVLAILLKSKGFQPVIFERDHENSPAGMTLGYVHSYLWETHLYLFSDLWI